MSALVVETGAFYFEGTSIIYLHQQKFSSLECRYYREPYTAGASLTGHCPAAYF
ncbi:hypothetical protein [Gloeomargarita lithophora]|uniref:hypothetical protein n=1 Tax=Gloeomargarita lithophora TaxID=1188228 RepID=UPI00155FEE26|nr:hypothetical protein [Gloeomargarita lithophora]